MQFEKEVLNRNFEKGYKGGYLKLSSDETGYLIDHKYSGTMEMVP
jgi:hypothetical protein